MNDLENSSALPASQAVVALEATPRSNVTYTATETMKTTA